MCSSGSHVLYLGEKGEVRAARTPLHSLKPQLLHQGPLSAGPRPFLAQKVVPYSSELSRASLGVPMTPELPHLEHSPYPYKRCDETLCPPQQPRDLGGQGGTSHRPFREEVRARGNGQGLPDRLPGFTSQLCPWKLQNLEKFP